MALENVHQQHAADIEAMLAEHDELSPEVRERLSFIAEQLRLGRMLEEIIPPNIRVDEPIPGHHKAADEARAASPTGDLPRTDITPPPPPELVVAPHAFGRAVRTARPSVADLNPDLGGGEEAAAAHERQLVAAGQARRFHPALPDVEKAIPEGDLRNDL